MKRVALGCLFAASLYASPAGLATRRVEHVESGALLDVVALTGRITADDKERFRAPIVPNWRVTVKWLAPEGAVVAAGDPIVRFDTGSLQAEFETAEISLTDKLSEAALREAEAAATELDKQLILERARIELEKAKVQAAVPKEVQPARDWEDKQLALEKAQSGLQTAEVVLASVTEKNQAEARQRQVDIEMTQDKLTRVKTQLDAMTLVAKQSGVLVLETNWRTGKRMKAGDQTWSTAPIAHIPDLEATRVLAFAGEAELSKLAVGQPARLKLDAAPSREFRGKITSVARSGDPNDLWGKSPLYPIDIAIETADLDLMRQGMSVRAEVLVESAAASLQVPVAALRTRDGKYSVRSGGKTHDVTVLAHSPFMAAIDAQGALQTGSPLDDGPFEIPSDQPAVLPASTAAARPDQKVVAQGTLNSRVKDSLGPSVPGIWRYSITHLAAEGQNVPAGTPVVGFDPKELTDRLTVRKSELEAARKELEKTVLEGQQSLEEMQLQLAESRMKLDKAKRKLEVPSDLVGGLQQTVEKYEADLAQLEFELNGRRVETARKNLEAKRRTQQSKIARWSADVQTIQRSIEMMQLKAPRAGCVVYVVEDQQDGKPRVGGEVWHGREVVEIADLSQMEVDARVPEPDASRVRLGQRAEIRLDVNPDRLFTGKVTELGRVFHAKSQETPNIVFDATISIENPDPELMRPGMAAEVTLLPDAAPSGEGDAKQAQTSGKKAGA
jgi:multidrug resistance efflux pump